MAFDIAGLGGTFAAGMMGGMQSAQKEREALASQREREYLRVYTDLVKSGEWEPVDVRKGVSDGGVLKVGNLGMLKQKKKQRDLEAELRLEKLFGEVQAQKSKPPVSRTRTTLVDADGKPMVADRHQEYVDGEWIDVEVVPKLKEPRDVRTYLLDGKPIHVRSNEMPPPGSMPAPTFVSGERLDMSKHEVGAFEAERKAADARSRVNKLYGTGLLALKGSDDEYAKSRVSEYVRAVGDAAEWTAVAAEQKKGAPDVVVKSAGQRARQIAEDEAKKEFVQTKEEKPSSNKKILNTLSTLYDKTQLDQAELWLKKMDELIQEREQKPIVIRRAPSGLKKSGKKPNLKIGK